MMTDYDVAMAEIIEDIRYLVVA
ncbi:hypothetical protein DSUL_50295 [Desulfovibrionales bacterium]